MTYYKDRLSLISDSHNNIDLFRLLDGKIIRYHFNRKTTKSTEATITSKAKLEYDACIDENDTIYVIYQNINSNLILNLLKGRNIKRIELSDKPLSQIYYLNILLYNYNPHIFYFSLLSGKDKKYRIYHHYHNNSEWVINLVDEITVKEVLNPMRVFKTEEEIIIAYYDYMDKEQIYINTFNLKDKEWREKARITDSEEGKLYLDLIYKDNKIHLTYCEYYGGNLIIKYERFDYKNGFISKEIEEEISSPESPQLPTFIYYKDRLWISWLEHDSVMSRYSDTNGNSWNSIYRWKESKNSSIVRYKYSDIQNRNKQILNYSFGKIKPSIGFIGFGPLKEVEEVPLKKKIIFQNPKKRPQKNI